MGNERFDISIPKEYLTRDKARLLYVSSATYGGDWISTPHTHYCSELFYVIDGVGQFQVEDNIFPVSANDLVVINPNVSHTELGFNARLYPSAKPWFSSSRIKCTEGNSRRSIATEASVEPLSATQTSTSSLFE